MENKTKTFGEWWCRKLNRGVVKNDPEIRDLTNEAWNEAINLKEIFIVIELFPELRPVKGILKKIKCLFKRRISTYYYSPIKGVFSAFRLAQSFIDTNKKDGDWGIIRKELRK